MALSFSIGGVYEVVAEGVWNSAEQVRNVYQLQKVDGGTIPEAQGLEDIEAWLTLVLNIIVAVQSTLIIWKSFTVNALEGTATSGSVPLTADIPGELTGDPLPPGVALLFYMNTGVKHRQLRKYIPGCAESSIGAFGGFSSATLTALAGMDDLLLNDYNGTNGDWRYGHYRTGVPDSFVFPTTFTATAVPSYQRRRRQGRGI